MESGKSSFEKWMPVPNFGNRFDVSDVGWGVVTLVLDQKQPDGDIQKMQLIWEPSQIIAYHVTDETFRADCWGLDFENMGRFYVSRDSEYIEMLKQKSSLFPDNAIHFLIVGTDIIVDVLAKEYPTIKSLSAK